MLLRRSRQGPKVLETGSKGVRLASRLVRELLAFEGMRALGLRSAFHYALGYRIDSNYEGSHCRIGRYSR
jgi:hypothetical protein